MIGNCSVPMHFMPETLLIFLSDVNVLVSGSSECVDIRRLLSRSGRLAWPRRKSYLGTFDQEVSPFSLPLGLSAFCFFTIFPRSPRYPDSRRFSGKDHQQPALAQEDNVG